MKTKKALTSKRPNLHHLFFKIITAKRAILQFGTVGINSSNGITQETCNLGTVRNSQAN